MIPILSGIIAGAGDDIGARRAFVLSVVYVLASALVFTIAGVVAGLAGQNLQAAFQKPWILASFAALFVALSFSMFGYYELQLPASWQGKITEFSNKQQGGSLIGVAIMGALSALIVGPCVAPPLAAAVVYIGQQHDPVLGGFALFALALGMGAPLIAFGTGVAKLPRAGGWMDAVKYAFGVVFLLLAVWMLERFVDPALVLALLAAIFIGSGIHMGALEPLPPAASGVRRTIKAAGLLLLLLGVAELIGALSGAKDYLAPLQGIGGNTVGKATSVEGPAFKRIKSGADLDRELEAAKSAGKPAILDFYADWCVSCKEMEKYTFPAAAVRDALAGFVLLKADVTANDDVDQALMKRFGIIGPPATLFFGRDGAMRENLRLVGFEEAAKFSERLGRAAQ
jgi:thiol:disulfide interchange protein DsbD